MRSVLLVVWVSPLILGSCTGSHLPTTAGARGKVVQTGDFSLPLPEGYRDISAEIRINAPHLGAVLEATESAKGYRPTIVVRKVPLRGGSFADEATCAETGKGLLRGGTEEPGTEGTLKSTAIIDGPIGKTCQIHLLAAGGIALITELHRPGNTPKTPQVIWLMTCNHADGDDRAEAVCRATLAGFRFRD